MPVMAFLPVVLSEHHYNPCAAHFTWSFGALKTGAVWRATSRRSRQLRAGNLGLGYGRRAANPGLVFGVELALDGSSRRRSKTVTGRPRQRSAAQIMAPWACDADLAAVPRVPWPRRSRVHGGGSVCLTTAPMLP
jgi:hypothetical protein